MLKIRIISFILIVLLGYSCKFDQNTILDNAQNGEIEIKLKKEFIPTKVKLLKIIIQKKGESSIIKEYASNKNKDVLIYIEKIKIGSWKLSVFALDSLNNTLSEGFTSLKIVAGNIAVADVKIFSSQSNLSDSIKIITSMRNIISSGWRNYANNPLIEAIGNDFDKRGVVGSYVIKESNNYKMWYFTYSSKPGGFSYIYFAESSDGLSWNRSSEKPALYMGEEGSWDWGHVGGQAVIKIEDQYVMYYTGWKNFNYDWNIGRAVSNDGQNWIKDQNPVLYAKDSTSWEYKLQVVDIKKINGAYYMYYHGKRERLDHKIGLAVSHDGKSWRRHKNNPILEVSALWEGAGVYYPTINKVGDKYIMLYSNSGGPEQSFGFAYSEDGIVWEKEEKNPIFRTSEMGDSIDKASYPQIIHQENKDILYYTSLNFDGTKTIKALIKKK